MAERRKGRKGKKGWEGTRERCAERQGGRGRKEGGENEGGGAHGRIRKVKRNAEKGTTEGVR